MTTITEAEANDLLADMLILSDIYGGHKEPGEFTTKDFQLATHKGYDTCNDQLNRALVDGKVTQRKIGARIYWKFAKAA